MARGNEVGLAEVGSAEVVSIRPRPDGQGKRGGSRDGPPADSFNPPPARWPGETCCWCGSSTGSPSFNPPPARWPGETAFQSRRSKVEVGFQSAPGPMARGNLIVVWQLTATPGVSIRPRPDGRGKPRPAFRSGTVRCSFNPPPARWPGETRHLVAASGLRPEVSIRPRPDGQGKPSAVWQGEAGKEQVSIRPRPDGQGKPP